MMWTRKCWLTVSQTMVVLSCLIWVLLVGCNKSVSESVSGEADTTSHDFVWVVDTIGSHGSTLFDVQIIDENTVWVVGEIHTDQTDRFDSLGNWIDPYGAAQWDGNDWNLFHIYLEGDNPSVIVPIRGVLYFSPNNIWFATGSVFHFDGTSARLAWERDIASAEFARRFWSRSADEFYVVGDGGLILRYHEGGFSKLESSTELPIQDVWGETNPTTGGEEIICVASKKYEVSEKAILSIDSNTDQISHIDWPYQDRRIHSIWFENETDIWICGAGIFLRQEEGWNEFTEVPVIFTNRIRGQKSNDVFVAGDFGIVAHFNGSTWRQYPEVGWPLYESLDYFAGLMVSVGSEAGNAFVLRMSRP